MKVVPIYFIMDKHKECECEQETRVDKGQAISLTSEFLSMLIDNAIHFNLPKVTISPFEN